MKTFAADVIIIGAGPAGVTAAGVLAGSGISVAVIEAGVYAGAENWSGCVYFAESLAEKDCFGPAAVQNAPFERSVVRRGTWVHNGVDTVGLELAGPAVYRHCYTVLRPLYDPYFAGLAKARGAIILTGTTVLSLIRKAGRVIGVSTDRGPLYASVVFIAEGDASHLVAAEGLERVAEPHYLQGVKAMLSLPSAEIERRFRLRRGEGAACEILVRNASMGGRTARLNAGGFLYTNRDSLSFGYVVPVENLKRHYRGDHGLLFEWMRSLPHLRDLLQGATLSAYGAKIIRSGGWSERPVLVEDGLAVGGASAGLGIDLPFPNFTGPASATGLYFARAVRSLLRDGRSLDARNLDREYVEPLRDSVYGRNARHLSSWPAYFGRTSVLFGRTADVACGTPRFLAAGGMLETGRFLRKHVLSLRGIGELAADTAAALTALRLWKPLGKSVLAPATWMHWTLNLFRAAPAQPDPQLEILLHLGGMRLGTDALPWPLGPLLRRTSPALAQAVAAVYANDGRPVEEKFAHAVRIVLRSLRVTDLVALPLYALSILAASAMTGLGDAFRYYVLRTPFAALLAEPVMAYQEALRKARDLNAPVPSSGLEARLATNSYHVGGRSHIRTLWPEAAAAHTDMARTSLWWVCPAGVYDYRAPLSGRGRIGVNWENCIKCETCWRAEPSFVLWGRFSDHRLIYRPRTEALPLLLEAQRQPGGTAAVPREIEKRLWYTGTAVNDAAKDIARAAAAFRESLSGLPASSDHSRRTWPVLVGEGLCGTIAVFEDLLHAEGHADAARDAERERRDIGLRLREGRLFHALYCTTRLEQRLCAWMGADSAQALRQEPSASERPAPLASDEVSRQFPDRTVKAWEEEPMPQEWAEKLRDLVGRHRQAPWQAVRTLSAVSPALGLMAACQMQAGRLLEMAGREPIAGLCAAGAGGLTITKRDDGASLAGVLSLVPAAAATGMLIVSKGSGYIIPFSHDGVSVAPTPAIGFRAAGLAELALDCAVGRKQIIDLPPDAEAADPASYLAIALGAGDYLWRRVREHAAGRVQFPGLMQDTEGRDGIAKFGAVKALVARIEAWRLLLETLSRKWHHPSSLAPCERDDLGLLCSALSAMAFGPESGSMAWDAGQVFGGFAYSEDDLLSRSYRDSALFRFLTPGYGAAGRLRAALDGPGLREVMAESLGALPQPGSPPLGASVLRWNRIERRLAAVPAGADRPLSGEAAALLLGIRALLADTGRGLASGRSSEAEAACADVLLGLADDAVMRAELSAGRGGVPPDAVFPAEPTRDQVALDLDYESFCSLRAQPYRSGTFLLSVFDRSPRYVPEMQLHDRDLRPLWSDVVSWFKQNCRDRTVEGLPFERYVEKNHGLPGEILDAVRRNRWLATYLPPGEDGLGWRKANYYVLNSVAATYGDASVCLLIMASTSIGTTPVLLGLEDELPRVREELEPLVKDGKHLGEIGSRLRRIVASFDHPDPGRIRREFEAVMRLVDSRIRRTRVVKYLAANFLKAFFGAGLSGQRGDFAGFRISLEKAAGLFDHVLPDVRSALEELPRRERSHKLFLKMLGHGGVSAFALTEPTAGSDSGGVRTTAVLKAAMLSPLPDGRYAFSPTGEFDKCLRYLIDADRIVFTAEGMAYLCPDDRPALIRYGRNDQGTGEGARSFEFQEARCEFHDIGQVRRTDKGPVYEYYSITGSKMWITNGSVATQFSLYAQTAEGVTGFMVDRRAEGLTVGADEKKTGQRGSPTNELALDGVRVPREAVIGYEGHGQVNALETLNVGRCGLAVVAGALGRKVLEEARAGVPASAERDRLLGEAAAVLFGSESLACHLVGLFDRPRESVRMESAIAKFVCAEDVHEVLALVEQAFGPAGQTERHLVEKARRDARILNIYEGTNEVQRFLVLRDLVTLAADWPELPERIPERPGDEHASVLAQWKNRVRRHIRSARALLGDAAWSDAMLQPVMFLLPEMAAEVLRLECIWHRTEWLEERRALLGKDYSGPLLAAGTRAAERTLVRLAHQERKFEAGWERIVSNRDAPEVQAADALLDQAAQLRETLLTPLPAALRPLRILVVLRPVADLPPDPQLDRGRLRELVWQLDLRDRSSLELALVLRASGGGIRVEALLTGGPRHEELLRSAAAAADAFIRLGEENADPAMIAAAVQDLEQDGPYDLILCGARTLDGSDGLAPFLAGFLDRELAPSEALADPLADAASPLIVAMHASVPAGGASISALLSALRRDIRIVRAAAGTKRRDPLYALPETVATSAATARTAAAAAELLTAYAARQQATAVEAYDGIIEQGEIETGPAAWALLDPATGNAGAAALRAARLCADLFGRRSCAFIAAPRNAWPGLLGLARMNGVPSAYCMDTAEGALSASGMRSVLAALMNLSGDPMVFAGTPWDDALGTAAGALLRAGTSAGLFLRCTGAVRDAAGQIVLALPAYEGKLIRKESLHDGTAFVSLSGTADLPPVAAGAGFRAVAIDLALTPAWTEPLRPAPAPSLERAEVIIDIGYGIRDAGGMSLANELKAALEGMGLAPLFGATRKVTQDLKLLPLDVQIGQTGVRVAPRIIIALGISGAPQHIDYLGLRTDILCFNKDPEAPLMRLNDTRPSPRVHPIVGDLFVTVRELIGLLHARS